MKNLLLVVFLISSFFGNAQYRGYKRQKVKKSYAEGTISFYWGYNRSAYTRSTIQFFGPGYDFTLANVQAKDRPTKDFSKYFSIKDFTEPQFNFRIGYNFKNYWMVSVGWDHMKYVMQHNQPYLLTGRINPGVDNVTNWSGTYGGDTVFTEEPKFHYENSNGMNYIRLEFTYIKPWFKTVNGNFLFTTLVGPSFGGLLNYNDFTFAGRKDIATPSMSGFGVSGHAAIRLEFFKHVFLQFNGAAGFMAQSRVKTRPNNYDTYARHHFGYTAGDIVVGGIFYLRPKNGCDSCPHW